MEIVVSPPMVHHVEHTAQKEIPRQQPSGAEEDLYPPCIIEEEILPSTTKELEMNQDTPPPTHEGTDAGTAKQPAADTTRQSGKKATDEKELMNQATVEKFWHLPLVFELRNMLDDLKF